MNNIVVNNHISDRKLRHNEITKEGVILNNFIRDSEIVDNSKLFAQKTSLPGDMFEKKNKDKTKWYHNPLIPMIGLPLLILGLGVGFTRIYKNSFINKFKIPSAEQIPNIGRIVTINDDNKMVLFLLVQDPSVKSLLATIAVFASSAMGFIMKNVVDGIKDIQVKKQVANIKQDKEEKLIDIETRSFAGKNQIIRNLIAQKEQELESQQKFYSFCQNYKNNALTGANKNLTFKGNTKDKMDQKQKMALYGILAAATVLLSIVFTKSILKNIGSIAKHMEKIKAEVQAELQKNLKGLSEVEIKKLVGESKVSEEAKHLLFREWRKINLNESVFQSAPEMIGGIPNKTSFSSVVSDVTSFIYTYIINPTPQTRDLAILLCSSAALGYVGEKTVEGIKDVQVEKNNTKTEINLQDRLVQVELNNFYQKKLAYVNPLMEIYMNKFKLGASKEELAQMKNHILSEIKNGPPFVYS